MASRIIPSSRIREGSEVPIELIDFIERNQWLMICQAAKTAQTEGDVTACALECCCCVLFAFPCIFCCHPVCANSFAETNLRDRLANLNRTLFGGQPVLMLAEQMGILFNLDYVPRSYSAPTYSVFLDQSANIKQPPPIYFAPSSQTPEAQIVNPLQAQRSMWVTLPDNVQPRATLTIQSPDGVMITITAPDDSYPGKQIMVTY